MTPDELLTSLDGVQRTRRGWLARCPAHNDRNPSLAIAEGERGLLLRCWAGCTFEQIMHAIGRTPRDAFYDTEADPDSIRAAQRKRQKRQRREDLKRKLGLASVRACQDAQGLVESARGVDILNWTEAELDAAMHALGDAYELLEQDDFYEHVS